MNSGERPVVRLRCCCCGGETRGRQHWNRDTGYGLCVGCIELVSRKQSPEQVQRDYGTRGIDYDIPE